MSETQKIPPGWIKASVKDISISIQYGYTESSTTENIGPKFLRITDIQDNNVYWQNVPYCKISEAETEKYLLHDGDLVFARTGATVGKSFLIKGSIPKAIFASYLIRLRFPEQIFDKYISYYFQSPFYWNEIINKQVGTGQPNVNGTILGILQFPLSPIPEQHRIVAKIEELFSSLDKGVESLKTAQAQLKTYRQAVLKWAFEGKLTNVNVKEGELPEGWKLKLVKEISSVLGDGLHGTPIYSDDGEYYFINGNNLSDGKIEIKENTKQVSFDEFKKYKKTLNDRTILVSINGTLGNTAFYNNEKVILGKSACYFNVLENVDKKYIRYCITSHRFINYANKTATGSTIKNVGLKAMREFEIPLPSTLAEQHRIVSEIETRLSVCDKLEESITQSLVQAEALRQSILKKAFAGKLVPQDSNDEPAGVLLERIRTERAKRPKKKTRSTKVKK